ncbi:hypothetical protein FML70_28045 [Raoultella planticola]|nr:hypothetical protein [Raoultella planticola]
MRDSNTPLFLSYYGERKQCVVSIFSLIQIFKEQNFTMHFSVHFEIYHSSDNLCEHYKGRFFQVRR